MTHSLYVMGTGWDDAVKIGVSAEPTSRLNTFNEMHPHELSLLMVVPLVDAYSVEAHVHRIFEDHRLNGEWFQGSALSERTVMAAINSFEGRRRAKVMPDQFTVEAMGWAKAMVEAVRFSEGIRCDDAMVLTAERTGLRHALFWSLHYRPTKQIFAADYFALKAANEALLEPKGNTDDPDQ